MLCHDFVSVLGIELLYWECPPISENESIDLNILENEKVEVLNKISLLLQNPDDNRPEIKKIMISIIF
jgi:hypothetical protein